MRVVNRTAVTITGAQPFIDWMRNTDADFNRGAITVPRAKAYGSAFLLPEFDLEEDLQEWVEDNPDLSRMVPCRHPQRRGRRGRR
jgi:hypothetical protein